MVDSLGPGPYILRRVDCHEHNGELVYWHEGAVLGYVRSGLCIMLENKDGSYYLQKRLTVAFTNGVFEEVNINGLQPVRFTFAGPVYYPSMQPVFP